MALEVGVRAPLFTAAIQDGSTRSLKSFRGKWVVLFFYPEDDTPTCTKQACDFRDNLSKFTSQEAVVMGVSPNGVSSHRAFIEKFGLNVDLIADEQRKLCEKYDVWKLKKLYGRSYMGVVRTTYVIDPKGIVAAVWTNVRTKGHADAVAARLMELRTQ